MTAGSRRSSRNRSAAASARIVTLSTEKALLACFAKAAGAGEMLNIHNLKAAYEQAIGHPTSNCTIYNLLTYFPHVEGAISGQFCRRP
jgi:hypothetical protein